MDTHLSHVMSLQVCRHVNANERVWSPHWPKCACREILSLVHRCVWAHAGARAHTHTDASADLFSVFQQSGWFMPWILQCFRWDLREFTAICPNFPPSLSLHTHSQMQTHTHKLYHTHVHTHTHYFQLKGQGQNKSVCRFECEVGGIRAIRQTVRIFCSS